MKELSLDMLFSKKRKQTYTERCKYYKYGYNKLDCNNYE